MTDMIPDDFDIPRSFAMLQAPVAENS